MRISVFGIGYVGAIISGCMANRGHHLIAVDVNEEKVDLIRAGRSTVVEPGIDEIISAAVRQGHLCASTSAVEAILGTDLSFVCVGTPGLPTGELDMSFIVAVSEQIGEALRQKRKRGLPRHTVVLRSTILPGGVDKIVVPALERASGLKAGEDFGLGYCPEFLREGRGVEDFFQSPLVVIGGRDATTLELLRTLNAENSNCILECDIPTAEAVKSVANAWHALKITFSNEIGSICRAYGLDGAEVMEMLCADTKLNLSRAYMKPGFSFGGSCLPKDVKALLHHARARYVSANLLEAVLAANDLHIARAIDMIAKAGRKKISLFGLTFKPSTDDLRNSPLVELAERLHGKGYQLKIFDPSFSYDEIFGSNRRFILSALPHLATMLVNSIDAALEHGETLVIGHNTVELAQMADRIKEHQNIVDLAGGALQLRGRDRYAGICW